ncbi:tRNA uridine-5-carboxymethylaminomethyl(34) synthesis enzyme MnmG [Leptolyngbya sp. 7M]|uniref:tRNA uridine-5-carboxymethylaminomethyl(34) synthesis enzyme MnmG n=1 Tax=Leptolyngbya sp. 7M TaxID=2812896 RepID=UPI001B8AE1E4|nr:tRNA uridine-5-carboxymethylaminomethyl(34) synthesis enzyme MnmG [Leptolyngbya sp. 7M]QYO66236.1 tRNA uridine-5-carboxymethylaminomethyl(34) synthesis enzyme MnmG [Leptolyngbya sp. 7M]
MFDERFDVIVIGAGHAGCEAASASARLGASTALVTINLDLIGQMSCNPAVGGIAKGHVVREIDALGGIMGRVIDRTGIQFRLLNRSRGPAVRSPRAQADRGLYRTEMRRVLEATPNLHLRQGLVIDLIVENNTVIGVEMQDTRRFEAKAVIIATGTFLNGTIHTGQQTFSAGRAGEPASIELAESLKRLGFPVGRLKTGTPPRLDGRTIDWDAFEPQPPDEKPVPFSFSTERIEQPQIQCFIGYTSNKVHQSIRDNLHRSPLYSGKIKGVGPRYCPSIEDKVVKFAGKDRHQLFLEPEGHTTNEVYLNGFSTSLPSELQLELLRMIPGFESVQIIRPGYAIEYDYVDPREMLPTMASSRFEGLFLAGQINGTTGYEEAACQGLMAGINAAFSVQRRKPLILERDKAYIGVLVDDLIRHGVDEPYRLFTSRAEARLLLRHDNADQRLSAIGREAGLVGDADWERFEKKRDRLARLRNALDNTRFKRSSVEYAAVSSLLDADLGDAFTLSQLGLRQGIEKELLIKLLPSDIRNEVRETDLDSALADSLYAGYIEKLRNATERVNHHDSLKVPESFNFGKISGLSNEMVERLERARPRTFSQVRSIPGLTPAALSTVLVHLTALQPSENTKN